MDQYFYIFDIILYNDSILQHDLLQRFENGHYGNGRDSGAYFPSTSVEVNNAREFHWFHMEYWREFRPPRIIFHPGNKTATLFVFSARFSYYEKPWAVKCKKLIVSTLCVVLPFQKGTKLSSKGIFRLRKGWLRETFRQWNRLNNRFAINNIPTEFNGN